MKRIIALVLTMVAVFALVCCGGMSEKHTEEDGQRLLEEVKAGYVEYNRRNQEYICTIIETEYERCKTIMLCC